MFDILWNVPNWRYEDKSNDPNDQSDIIYHIIYMVIIYIINQVYNKKYENKYLL
jgi:hypothetical protein